MGLSRNCCVVCWSIGIYYLSYNRHVIHIAGEAGVHRLGWAWVKPCHVMRIYMPRTPTSTITGQALGQGNCQPLVGRSLYSYISRFCNGIESV